MRRAIIIFTLLINCISICAQSRWITNLADSTSVSRLSIPGTHDSATGEGIKGFIKQGITQEKSIAQQWQCGIRAFDLRPAVCNDELHICHGPLKTKISFAAAIDTLLTLLESNPEEFAIVLLRQERGNSNRKERDEWSKKVGQQINQLGERAAIFHPSITVGELRGKILFISRNHYDGCNKGALIKGWSHSQEGTKEAEIVPYSPNHETARLYMQDFYSPTHHELCERKLITIIEFIDYAATSAATVWCINHLSGYSCTLLGIEGVASNKGYKKNASYNNRAIYDYLIKENKPSCCGIIMLDYAGSEKIGKYQTYGKSIVEAIINLNFKDNNP